MKKVQTISRRNFLGTAAAAVTALSVAPLTFSCAASTGSKFGGVQNGVITYS